MPLILNYRLNEGVPLYIRNSGKLDLVLRDFSLRTPECGFITQREEIEIVLGLIEKSGERMLRITGDDDHIEVSDIINVFYKGHSISPYSFHNEVGEIALGIRAPRDVEIGKKRKYELTL